MATATRPLNHTAYLLTRHLIRKKKMPLLRTSFSEFSYVLFEHVSNMVNESPHDTIRNYMRNAREVWRTLANAESVAVEATLRMYATRLRNSTFFELNVDDLVNECVKQILLERDRLTWTTSETRKILRRLMRTTARKMTECIHRETGRHPTDWNRDCQAMPLDGIELMDPSNAIAANQDDREFDLQNDDEEMLRAVLDDLIEMFVDPLYPEDADIDRMKRNLMLHTKLEKMTDTQTARLLRGGTLPNTIAQCRRRLYHGLVDLAQTEWLAGSEDRWVMVLHNRYMQERKLASSKRNGQEIVDAAAYA